jgi:hypothetical protein
VPRFIPPSVHVLVLEGFIARPGHAARPGEIIEVPTHVANTVIAMGKARLPTPEDQKAPPHEPKNRDPVPTHRDPTPSRRKR